MTASERPGSCAIELAQFILSTPQARIPAVVRHETQRAFVNMIGAALSGCRDPAIDGLIQGAHAISGEGPGLILGRSESLDVASAAGVNGAAANALDFDDAHVPTVIHPAALAGSSALAIASLRAVDGNEFLDAMAMGIEVSCRLGNAISPSHYRRGFHITTTCGVMGAAAAAGRLLGLTVEQMAHALGIAATRAGGLVENIGYAAKSVGVAGAARDGLMAAILAQAGLDAAPKALEGTYGFLNVFCDEPRQTDVLQELGNAWEVMANTYKPYPVGVVLNPVIDAALELAVEESIRAHDIASVVVTGAPLLLERTNRPEVVSERQAKVSLQHAVAVAFIRRSAALEDFSQQAVDDTAIRMLRSKVSAVADADFVAGHARVTVTLTNGNHVQREVRNARGSLARPMTDEELTGKLKALAAFGAPHLDADRLSHTLWNLADTRDVGETLRQTATA